jgi:glycerol-3-phosphate dehydrogenase subunit B
VSVIEYDVIIIGAGIAGLTAGTRLAERGLKVACVTTGEPTACLSTGCIDVCAGDQNPLFGVSHLPLQHPFHLVRQEIIREALSDFSSAVAEMRLPYVGVPDDNRLVLSALGTLKKTCLVPITMRAAPQNTEEDIHIITFQGLKDFYPSYIISRRKNAAFSTYDAGVSTTMGIAAKFEQDEFLEAFILWLDKLNIRENKIAFPAVLGLESALNILNKIEYRLERPVFEIPTIPPSMPGRRLFNALKDYFRRKGGSIYWGWPVVGVEKTGRVIEAVITHSEGRPNSLNAKAFVLASGSFVGGGLTATRESIIENVFDLPVQVPGPREGWYEQDYFSVNHGIGKAGIIVDASFRSVDSPWENVFVCGAILANAEILRYGCGNGLSLCTGQAAALSCAEYVR